MLLTRRPIPPLATHVEMLWASERGALPHTREFNLPTGRVDIVIPLLDGQRISRFRGSDDRTGEHFDGGVLHGAHDHACQRDTTGASCVVGVHFKPGGAAAFFGGALPALRNRTVPLDTLWGPSARALREELQDTPGLHGRLLRLEAYLVARLALAPPRDQLVAQAVQSMAHDPTGNPIEPLQRASGLGPTRFIARFERQVGLTPKRYARVLRFHALVSRLAVAPSNDWALTAAEAGYTDQPHLIHEFKRITGMTPTAYTPLHPDQPTHMAVPRAGR
jgi:AraC-like DNA-binding protein